MKVKPDNRKYFGKEKRRKGIALLWAAITLLVLILFMGIAIDGARVYLAANQLQNAADAAALAGARTVRTDQDYSREQAKRYGFLNNVYRDPVELELNGENAINGDIVVGWYNTGNRTFRETTDPVNALKVVARRTDTAHGPIPLVFGPIARVNTANVSRYAIAMAEGGFGAALIVLKCDDTGLEIQGNASVTIISQEPNIPGYIQVNSRSSNALEWIGGSAQTIADAINIVGGYSGTPPDTVAERIATKAPYMPDPLCPASAADCGYKVTSDRCLSEPTWNPSNDLGDPNNNGTWKITGGTQTFSPGYYSGGFDIGGNANVILQPGVYVLGGGNNGEGGLIIGGSASFCAQGVMFYITEGGKVDIGGTGIIRITELKQDVTSAYFCDPSFSYPADVDFSNFEGLSIYQDRGNTTTATIIGTGLMDIDGTLYFPLNHVILGGTGDGFGTQLIAWSIEVRGNPIIKINYDGRNFWPANRSYLVE